MSTSLPIADIRSSRAILFTAVGFCIAACFFFDQHHPADVTRALGPLSTIEVSLMRSFIRNALLGVTGVVALSLSAHAAGSTAVTDTPLFKPTTTTNSLQIAQRSENPGGGMFGGMYKKSQTKKTKKEKKK
jgi:hypothetical protein